MLGGFDVEEGIELFIILCGLKTSWILALKKKPRCQRYHLLKGIVLWEMASSDKLEAYAAFLEVTISSLGAMILIHVSWLCVQSPGS